MSFTLINEVGSPIPPTPFEQIKNAALSPSYELNLIFTTPEHIQQLNLTYRNKNTPTDILSFPLSETEGEIYMSEPEIRSEAKKFGRDYDNFVGFLFIHGCTHLKGYDHGAIMEDIETDLRKRFGI